VSTFYLYLYIKHSKENHNSLAATV